MNLDITSPDLEESWMWIWRLPLPPNIIIFIWKACHNRLATKDNLIWLQDKSCPLCSHSPETAVHVLRDCFFFARRFWDRFHAFSTTPEFCQGDFRFWLKHNLQWVTFPVFNDISWSISFAMALWQLWC